MAASDVHEGFWPNIAPPPELRPALAAGEIPIALEAAPTIAAIEAGAAADPEPVVDSEQTAPAEPVAADEALTPDEAPSPDEETPLELAVEEAEAHAEAAADAPAADLAGGPIALGAPAEPAAAIALGAPEPALAEPAPVEPIALGAPEPAPVEAIAVEPAPAEPVLAEPVLAEAIAVEPAPIEAPVAAVATIAVSEPEIITNLAAELDPEQRLALADVIDLADFGADPVEDDIDAAHLDELPRLEPSPTVSDWAHAHQTQPERAPAPQASIGGANLERARAENPRTLAAHRELEAAVMTGTESLTEFDRLLIGLVVAIENRSGYWQVHLQRRLGQWRTPEQVDALVNDWTTTDLAVRERAMLAFAVKLTLVPGQMSERDAQLLGSVGFNERDLLDIVDVIAYWGFATRVAEGLGVFVEPWLAGSPEPQVDEGRPL